MVEHVNLAVPVKGSIVSERRKVIERARAGSPADAAFLIADYNRRRFMYKEESLSWQEISPELDQLEIERLERQANALFADEGYFGEKHRTGRSHEDIYKEMRQRHPGFGQAAYDLALIRCIIAMR